MTNLEFYKEDIKKEINEGIKDLSIANSYFYGIDHVYRKYNEVKEPRCIFEIIDWLCEEHKEPILDVKEKEYLSNVIRPYKKIEGVEIVFIKSAVSPFEGLRVSLKVENNWETYLDFPPFKEGTMYKGMELNKRYTLEELGL